MADEFHDRLTALDTVFLDLESRGVHMHVGSVGILDPGPLATADGGTDFERIVEMVSAGLHKAPRFRQKLARTPVTGNLVWVDDPHFNLLYHVRHTSLPHPGGERLLKRLAGRIMSQKLDTEKPMWEIWIVEGLEEGRLGMISKIHHSLIDGLSGVELLSAFMGPDPDHRIERPTEPWQPRPAPGSIRLLADEVARRATLPSKVVSGVAEVLSHPRETLAAVEHAGTGFLEAMANSMSPASETPFNVPIGPHRRFDWTRFDLDIVREVKARVGGKLNDVVLATVAGGVRSYLRRHGVDVDQTEFRVFVPVSTRTAAERSDLGNRVSMIVARMPVDEPDPRRRVERVIEVTTHAKQSGQADGTKAVGEISDWTTSGLLAGLSRMAASRRAYNMVVTNVPGPPMSVYMDGSRLLESYPLVPLFDGQALGIALLSYDGGLHWGFNADWDAIPDLHDFVGDLDQEFEILRKL